MAKKREPRSVVYGSGDRRAPQPAPDKRLTSISTDGLNGTRSARLLDTIRRDMDAKDVLFRTRRRNEEILSLKYREGGMIGGEGAAKNLRENATNLPYRYVRWLEAQAVGKKMVVKVNRDAGEGQVPSGPSDAQTGDWVARCLKRVAYEAGFKREMKAIIGDVSPRGCSVMRVGYHRQAISYADSAEVGKDAQSVVTDVLGKGDVEAKPGQAHEEISTGLLNMATDPMAQLTAGREGVGAILARKASHDAMHYAQETDDSPIEDTRETRHRLWMRKMRVGEECGWSPHVYDTADTKIWWERLLWTVAECKAAETLLSASFRAKCGDYALDSRTSSGVARGGVLPGEQVMGSDGRIAQSEDLRDDDEKVVEFFQVWIRRPDLDSGGIRRIVCAACPDEFIEADARNPHVYATGPLKGFGMIPGFFPFVDFTPILSSLPTPDRTAGVPLIAVGMTQFEQLAEINRLLHESALRHALRLYQIHPGLKDAKKILAALKNGEDGFGFVADQALVVNGKMDAGVVPLQFSGNTLEVERHAARLEGEWVKMQGMPPAVLQGVGTAGTAAQDNMGLAAGERESGALVGYFEDRTADVLGILRGLMRGNFDDEDYIRLVGAEGAAVMKAWANGTTDEGDEIEVAFGANAQAELTVRTKQVMEAINLLMAQVEPVTGMPKFDVTGLIQELCRLLEVGTPVLDQSMLRKLQTAVVTLAQQVKMLTGQGGGAPGEPGAEGAPKESTTSSQQGPGASEGDGPKQGNLAAGVARGTMSPNAGP